MAIDEHLKLTLEQHCFASMMGSISVVTFADDSRRETFAFVGGLPVPYGRFMAAFTAALFRHDADTGREWKVPIGNLPKIDPLATLWAKIALPHGVVDKELDPFHATPLITSRVKRFLLQACTHSVDEVRREQLVEQIERVESLMQESLGEPVRVADLSKMYDYPHYVPDFTKLVERFARAAEIIKQQNDIKLAKLLNAQNNDTY